MIVAVDERERLVDVPEDRGVGVVEAPADVAELPSRVAAAGQVTLVHRDVGDRLQGDGGRRRSSDASARSASWRPSVSRPAWAAALAIAAQTCGAMASCGSMTSDSRPAHSAGSPTATCGRGAARRP